MKNLSNFLLWLFPLAYIGLCMGSCLAKIAKADIVELKEVNFDFRNYFDKGRSPLITDNGLSNKSLDKRFALGINLDIADWFYFDNELHAVTDKDPNGGGQFRAAGWEFGAGVSLSQHIKFGYHHHSQHVLDTQYKPGFPVEDSLQLRVIIFQGRRGRGSVW